MVDLSTVSRDFSAEASARFFYYLSAGVVIVFLSRWFQPAEYGTLFLAISVLTVGRLFSSVGLAKSGAKHVSSYIGVDEGQLRHIVTSSLGYNLVTITVVVVAILLGAEHIAAALGTPAIEPLLLVGTLYIVFATLYNYTRVILQGFQEILRSALVYASEGLGRLVGVLLLVSIGYGSQGALIGYVFGFVIAAVLGLAFLRSRLPGREQTAPREPGLRRRILEYSVPLTVTRGAWVLDREIDLILVGYFLNPAVVGFYAISKQIVTFCSGPAGSLGFSLGPQFTETSVSESSGGAQHAYETTLVYVLLFYIPAVAGLAILASPVVRTVFGDQYRGIVPILQVFCAGIVLMAVTKLTEDILDYLGRANARAVFKIVTSVGNVALTIALIAWVGAVGAAIATVCMQAIYAALCLHTVKAELGLRTRYLGKQTVQILGITAVMSAVVLSLVQYVNGPFSIALVVLCGAATWAILAMTGGFFSVQSVRSVALSVGNTD